MNRVYKIPYLKSEDDGKKSTISDYQEAIEISAGFYALLVGLIIIRLSNREVTQDQETFYLSFFETIYPFTAFYAFFLFFLSMYAFYMLRTKYNPTEYHPYGEHSSSSEFMMTINIFSNALNTYLLPNALWIPFRIGCYLFSCYASNDVTTTEFFFIVSGLFAVGYAYKLAFILLQVYVYLPTLHCIYLWKFLSQKNQQQDHITMDTTV